MALDSTARGMAANALNKAKDYTDAKLEGVTSGTQYKGAVATVADLPATGNQTGDEWNVLDGSGMYVWNGTAWGSGSYRGPQGPIGPTGPAGRTYDVKLNGVTTLDADNIAQIEINPNQADQTTAKLTKLKIAGINYALQGGGASVYANISAMVTDINAKAKADLELGWNIYIRTIDVPDLWVSKNDEDTSVPYTYTTDAQFVADLNTASSTGLQIGYYRINKLETEKVNVPVQDIKNASAVSLLDIASGIATIPNASDSALGLVKTGSSYGTASSSGVLVGVTKTLAQYNSGGVTMIVSKGCLENILKATATTLPATLVNWTQYKLGNKSATFTYALPTGVAQGHIIIEFDATASFTPTCSTTTKGDTIPATISGKHYSFLYTYNGTNWVFSYLYY